VKPEYKTEPPVRDAPVPEGKAVEVTVSEPEKAEGAYTDEAVPPENKPYTDVTQEYLDNATPGEGKYTVDEGCVGEHYESEKDFAKWVHETFGGDINVNVEKQEKHGVSNPDYLWRVKLWDLKEPEQLTGANGRIKHGVHQIADNPGGVMLDLWKIDNVDYEELQKIIDRRMQWVHGVTIDIMIAYNRTLIKVLRYKK